MALHFTSPGSCLSNPVQITVPSPSVALISPRSAIGDWVESPTLAVIVLNPMVTITNRIKKVNNFFMWGRYDGEKHFGNWGNWGNY